MSHQIETLNTYNKIHKQFAEINNKSTVLIPHYNKFYEYLDNKNGLIYDVGCGTGRDTNALSNMNLKVIGLDYSEGMIETAKSQYPNKNFEVANILSDLTNKEKASGIWSCASLLHFTKDEFLKAISILYNLLEDKGIMYISLKISNEKEEETIQGRFFHYYKFNDLCDYFTQYKMTILFYERIESNGSVFGGFILQKN
jgi:trans-aconitate methyltransferase